MYIAKVKFLTVEAHKAGAFDTLESMFSAFAAQPGVEINSARYFESAAHDVCGLLIYYDLEVPNPTPAAYSANDKIHATSGQGSGLQVSIIPPGVPEIYTSTGTAGALGDPVASSSEALAQQADAPAPQGDTPISETEMPLKSAKPSIDD